MGCSRDRLGRYPETGCRDACYRRSVCRTYGRVRLNSLFTKQLHLINSKMSERTQSVKNQVISVQGAQCCNCGAKNNLHQHHIVPLSQGGFDTHNNTCILCSSCHRKVHNQLPVNESSELHKISDKISVFIVDKNERTVGPMKHYMIQYLRQIKNMSFLKIAETLGISDSTARKYSSMDWKY